MERYRQNIINFIKYTISSKYLHLLLLLIEYYPFFIYSVAFPYIFSNFTEQVPSKITILDYFPFRIISHRQK